MRQWLQRMGRTVHYQAIDRVIYILTGLSFVLAVGLALSLC